MISALPLVTLLLVFTNERHLLVWSRISIIQEMNSIIYHHEPWFYVNTSYSYLMIILATIVFLRAAIQKKQINPSQTVTMIIGLLLPWAANLIYVLDIDPLRGLNLTPAAFTITALTMIINISRLNLLNLMPTAREKVVDSMQDCLLVIDHNGRFIDLNPVMQQFISKLEMAKELISKSHTIGFPVQEVINNCPKLVSSIHSEDLTQSSLEFCSEDSSSYYDMKSTPFFDKKQNLVGKMVLLSNISSFKKAVQLKPRQEIWHRVC